MSKLVTIFGGSGFVGRYIARRMAQEGWRVRVAVRRPNEAIFVRPYGAVGQVEPVLCNIRDDGSVNAALDGAEVAINCVGILAEAGKNTFAQVQEQGADRVARLAAAAGVERFVHLSAIGADPDARSDYAKTKGLGEQAVLRHQPDAIILRPSVVFGPEDQFFNRFASMSRWGPILPVVGASTKFQPVYVDDVAKAAVLAATGAAAPGVYELGGPDISSFRELMGQMLGVINRRRLVVNVPFIVARVMGGSLDLLQTVSLGLLHNSTLTLDQVRNLAKDNVVSGDHMSFADLGVQPVSLEAVLSDYLWRFRPDGQYEELKSSARNLKT